MKLHALFIRDIHILVFESVRSLSISLLISRYGPSNLKYLAIYAIAENACHLEKTSSLFIVNPFLDFVTLPKGHCQKHYDSQSTALAISNIK